MGKIRPLVSSSARGNTMWGGIGKAFEIDPFLVLIHIDQDLIFIVTLVMKLDSYRQLELLSHPVKSAASRKLSAL